MSVLYDVVVMMLVFVLGVSIGAMVFTDDYTIMKRECEKDLPRTQHCKLIAVKAGGE